LLALATWVFAHALREHPSKRAARFKSLAAAAVIFTVLFAPWPMRNARTLHAFIPLRDNLGYELWQGNRAGANGDFTAALHPNASATEFARYAALGEVDYMREKGALASAAIRADKPRFLRFTALRMWRFWTGQGTLHPNALIVLHVSMTTLFGFVGALMLIRRKNFHAWLLLMPALLFPLPYYVTHADFRFRLVLDPVLTLLAAYAFTAFATQPEEAATRQP
jgi:hypothetical protein